MGDIRILVLGVGNVLLKDEAIGVRVIESLQDDYDFSPNVELMDGGTLGMRLLDPISQAESLIVVDAIQNGQDPGSLYRLDASEIEKRVTFKNSLHQLDLVQSLTLAEIMGSRPEAVIIGIEPADISPWGLEMSETVKERLPELCAMVLEEIKRSGGSWSRRTAESPVIDAKGTGRCA